MKLFFFGESSLTVLIRVLCLFFAFLLTHSASAEPSLEYPVDTAKRLQEKYDSMTSLSFAFSQRTKGEMTGRQKSGSGQAYFIKSAKSSKMRWNYLEPEQQVLMSDGVTVSMYFADLKQMIITPAESMEQDLTYAFFSGKGKLDRDFFILPPNEEYGPTDPAAKGSKIIKLVPQKKQSQVQNIHVWVSGDSLIERIDLRDHFDTITTLTFSDILVNPLAHKDAQTIETLFTFRAPEGTEIIHQ